MARMGLGAQVAEALENAMSERSIRANSNLEEVGRAESEKINTTIQ